MSDTIRDDDRFERVGTPTGMYPMGCIRTFAELERQGSYRRGDSVLRDEAGYWKRLPPILALPEEVPRGLQESSIAPLAAPSLESVPVGSRWRWKDDSRDAFTVIRVCGSQMSYQYDNTRLVATRSLLELTNEATRIDEPAGAGKATKLCNAQWGARYTCDLLAGHESEHRDLLLEKRAEKKAKPAMPPARCAPGCTPSKSCRITIPVTDKGTRYECPAFAEDRVKYGAMVLDHVDSQARDRYELRAMRDQRWEASQSGWGGVVGGVWRRR